MTTYWFRPKRYGYDATPTTWQGWLVIAAFVFVVATATSRLAATGADSRGFWIAVVIDVVALVALVIVTRRKTDGEWRWRWGDR
jgi:O-antigen/teichoic acid export membrane protein